MLALRPLALGLLLSAAFSPATAAEPAAGRAEARAVAFLAREVPRWYAENKCYSCHNNSVAARALYLAIRRGHRVPERTLADTSAWLARPGRWDDNGGDEAYSDKRLARVQFAAALADALDAGAVKDRKALAGAAALVAADQAADGSWPADAGNVGSPATLGTALATYYAARTLRQADATTHRAALVRAERWFLERVPRTMPDAAAVLLALAGQDSAKAVGRRKEALALIRSGESRDGGWGPYANSPPEVFDTAVVLLALAGVAQTAEVQAMRQRGRAYLVAAQQEDGGWPETTRPSGGDSYAQRIATSGWAALALLEGGKDSDRVP